MSPLAHHALRLVLALGLTGALLACGGGSSTTTPPSGSSSSSSSASSSSSSSSSSVTDNRQWTVPTPTYAAGSPELALFDQINAARVGAGVGRYAQSAGLDQAAVNHGKYLITNYYTAVVNGGLDWDDAGLNAIDPMTGLIGAHSEIATKPGFTGATASDEVAYVGLKTLLPTVNVIGFPPGDGVDCVAGMLASVFHRSPVLGFGRDVGIGLPRTPDGRNAACVLMFSSVQAVTVVPAGFHYVYPFDGQTGVLRQMSPEFPDPAPAIPGDQKGYPVSVVVDPRNPIQSVLEFSLAPAAGGAAVPALVLTTADFPSRIVPYEADLLPRQLLAANTVYTARFSATLRDGTSFMKSWRFTTR